MTPTEIIVICQAIEDGKDVQFRALASEIWVDYTQTTHALNFGGCNEWRVKPDPPKPRSVWLSKASLQEHMKGFSLTAYLERQEYYAYTEFRQVMEGDETSGPVGVWRDECKKSRKRLTTARELLKEVADWKWPQPDTLRTAITEFLEGDTE